MSQNVTLSTMISPAQWLAMEALVSGGSITKAATEAGVARETVSRWVHHDPVFLAQLHNVQSESLTHIIERVSEIQSAPIPRSFRRRHKSARLESCPTEGLAGWVGAHPVEENATERGHDWTAADEPSIRRGEKVQNKPTDDQPIRREEKVQNKPTGVTRDPSIGRGEKRQNKPTAARRTLVKMEPCVGRPAGSKATMGHARPGRLSSARRKGSTGPGFLQNGGTIECDLHNTSGAGFLGLGDHPRFV